MRRGCGAREGEGKRRANAERQGSENEIGVAPSVGGNEVLHEGRNEERADAGPGDDDGQSRAELALEPPGNDARVTELIGAGSGDADEHGVGVELTEMRREQRHRADSEAEGGHESGDELARIEAIEELADEGRAERDGNGGDRESARDLFAIPSKGVLQRLHQEAEAVDENGGEASQHADVTDGGDTPAAIAEARFGGARRWNCGGCYRRHAGQAAPEVWGSGQASALWKTIWTDHKGREIGAGLQLWVEARDARDRVGCCCGIPCSLSAIPTAFSRGVFDGSH